MRKWNIFLAGLALLLSVWVIAQPRMGRAASALTTATPSAASAEEKAVLEAALRTSSQSGQKALPAFLLATPVIDHYQISPDGKTALLWVALLDPQTQQPVATEPALVFGQRSDPAQAWKITLPNAGNWLALLQSLPDSFLSQETKALYLPVTQNVKTPAIDQVFGGYLLPWEGGKRVWLTGSVAHFTTYNSCSWVTVNGDYHSTCRYAFDFSSGTNFGILASRGGTVLGARWTCVNDDHNCLNYIALEDRSTNPVTTALYLHLAQNSIPVALRTVGTYANQGDLIALADNTGLSTGSHLHFMVVANRWLGTGYGGTYWWGDSVDITFSDVDINGGRPRLCSEAYYTPQYGTQCHPLNQGVGEWFDNWFVSGNRGSNPPPTAVMSAPAAYSYIYTPTLTVAGSASDNNGVARIQVVANYDNNWVEIGPAITSNPFSTSLDLCAAGVPNGPVTLALYAWDIDGNRSPLPQDPRPIQKNAICPPPAPKCNPSLNQVALYAAPDYQGVCQVFDVGKFNTSQIATVGDNQAASLQVGANVMALLYEGNYENGEFKNRSEAFLSSDPGLSDNRIGAKTVSSLEVKVRAKPAAPVLRAVLNQLDTNSNPVAPTSNDSILLTWKSDYNTFSSDEGGTAYRAELTAPDGSKRSSAWQSANSWSLGSLPAGAYSWTVTARNLLGETTAAPAGLTVQAAAPLGGSAQGVPYTDSFENGVNGWTGDGLWHQALPPVGNTTKGWGFTNGTSYADGKVAGGSLTSPSLNIPAGGALLKFRYFSNTEGAGTYWDQRRVQIAVNGSAFQDLLQLSDDPAGEWLNSPDINLTPYAGKTVRVRFYFNIVDKFSNGNTGWWIDDFSVSAVGGSTACAETTVNDTPAQAQLIDLNRSVPGFICPAGDVDYYRFNGTAGTTLSIDVVAKAEGSALDPYLYLLDGDGLSVLAENDDIQFAVLQDSHIGYALSRSGVYYLKVKAYSHPGVGGANYTYRLVLNGDAQPPVVAFTNPQNNWLVSGAIDVTAYAQDANSVSKVDFYWHNPDWRSGTWDLLASDTTPADGWKARFDPTGRTVAGSALLVRAYDPAGQQSASVIWNLQIDQLAPTSTLNALPASTQSTVIQLNWSGSDAGTGLKQFDLQSQDGTGAWTNWPNPLPASQTTLYFMGTAGHTYGFRLRGVDYAGNMAAFPAAAQAVTSIASTCAADGFDAAPGGDNTAATAALLAVSSPQEHNFCPAGDTDWARFTAQAGVAYIVKAMPLSGGAAASLAVTDASGQTLLVQARASLPGQTIFLKFVAPANAEYRVRVQPYASGLWGTKASYALVVAPSTWQYLPLASTP